MLEGCRLLSLPPELRRKVWAFAIGYGVHFHGQPEERMTIVPQEIKSLRLKTYTCRAPHSDTAHYEASKVYDAHPNHETGEERMDLQLEGTNHATCTASQASDRMSLHWMSTCRSIYSEASAVLYSETVLCFENRSAFQCLIWNLPDHRVSTIKNIHIGWSGNFYDNTETVWDFGDDDTYLPRLPALRSLQISIDLGSSDWHMFLYAKNMVWGDVDTFWVRSFGLMQAYKPSLVTVVVNDQKLLQHSPLGDSVGPPYARDYQLSVQEKRFMAESLRLFLLDSKRKKIVNKNMAKRMRQAEAEGRPILSALGE